jgi:hypothetical protein
MTRAQQVREALDLLDSPASERDTCRAHIKEVLDIIESVIRADENAKITRTAMLAYSDALRRMLAASKKHRDAGGALAIPHEVIERAVDFDKDWSANWGPYPRRTGQVAVTLARELLVRWKPAAISVYTDGAWNKLAALLCGEPGRNLYRQIQAFAK